MKKLLCILCLFFVDAHAKQDSLNTELLERTIVKTTNTFMEESNFSGIQVAVLYKDKMIVHKSFGYADVEHKTPFREETIVALGSNTKMFTGTSIQLLKNSGLIKLDDKIEQYLENNALLKGTNISIRQLLCHTSGLPDFFDIENRVAPNFPSFNNVISIAAQQAKTTEAGEKYQYNNTGYLLLGALIEKVSHQSLGDFYRENIIVPLELNNTYYLGDTFQPMNMAKSYDDVDKEMLLFNSDHENYAEYRIAQGAGALGGSLSDYIKWHTKILKGRLLPINNINEMVTSCTLNDGTKTKHGLGINSYEVEGEIYYRHGGAINGFVSDALYFPEHDLTVAFVGNSWKNPTKYKDFLIRDVLEWLNKVN